MSIVFVINKNGSSGLPVNDLEAQNLIKQKKASVVCENPYTIQLNYIQTIGTMTDEQKEKYKETGNFFTDNKLIIIPLAVILTTSALIDKGNINIGNKTQNNINSNNLTNTSSQSEHKGLKAPPEIEKIIQKKCKQYNMNPNLIRALIRQESGFNPKAVSCVGASGLCQLMPLTAKGLGVKNSFDPEQNIDGGVRYIKEMIKLTGSLELGIASYNAGLGAVQKYNGIPPYPETQNYVKKVMQYYKEYNG